MKTLRETTTLSEIWNHPEWKTKAKAFVKDKECERCGKTHGQPYRTKDGRTGTTILQPHHIERQSWGLKLRQKVANQEFSKWWKNEDNRADFTLPFRMSKREERKYIKPRWIRVNKALISVEYTKAKQLLIDGYINLSHSTIQVICKRCHFAERNGMIICPKCKNNYRKPQFEMCYDCFQESKR